MVHNPDKSYRSIDPFPLSRVDAEYAVKNMRNAQIMHIDDAVKLFGDNPEASWDLLKIKSTLREGDVVDLNKFRAAKQAAAKRSQPTAPPPDDDEVAALTLQLLFDKLIANPKWRHVTDRQDHVTMISVWDNKEANQRVDIMVNKVVFRDKRMNTPLDEVTVEYYDTGIKMDGEEFYHSL